MSSAGSIHCRFLVPGEADAPILSLTDPLSLWGGVDPQDGTIVDRHHPQAGRCISGMIVTMDRGRGSSSASSVLAEMIRMGTAPAAIVLVSADPILVLGAVVADELYHRAVPIALASPMDHAMVRRAARGVMDPRRGRISLRMPGPDSSGICR